MLKVLAPQYEDQDGIVHFDYKHPCGNWEKIYVHVFCKDCSYIRAPGLFADWHGSVAEKFSFDPKRVYFEDGQPPRHQLLFQNLDTFFGMEQNLSFFQVGPMCWRATTRRNDSVFLVLRLQHTIVAERCPPFFLPANHRIPIAWAGRRDADDDFVEPGKAVTPEAVTPPTPPNFKPWEHTNKINSILMNYQKARDYFQ